MSVVSIRLPQTDVRTLNQLASYFEEDKSKVINHSLKDFNEDID